MIRAIVVCVALAISGCAAVQKVVDALPTVVQYVQDAQFILDQIDRAAVPILAMRQDPKLSHQYAAAMDAARQSLQIALRSTKGGQALSQKQLDTAFSEFKAAYAQLTSLLEQTNLMNRAGTMSATPGAPTVSVPTPLAMSAQVDAQ